VKKLLGRNDIEDVLKRLDILTQEEARMATAEILHQTAGLPQTVNDVDEVKRSSHHDFISVSFRS